MPTNFININFPKLSRNCFVCVCTVLKRCFAEWFFFYKTLSTLRERNHRHYTSCERFEDNWLTQFFFLLLLLSLFLFVRLIPTIFSHFIIEHIWEHEKESPLGHQGRGSPVNAGILVIFTLHFKLLILKRHIVIIRWRVNRHCYHNYNLFYIVTGEEKNRRRASIILFWGPSSFVTC